MREYIIKNGPLKNGIERVRIEFECLALVKILIRNQNLKIIILINVSKKNFGL